MARLAMISFGALVLALAALTGLDALTTPHLSTRTTRWIRGPSTVAWACLDG